MGGQGRAAAAVTMLRTVGLVEQVPVPGSRRDHFSMRPDAWVRLMSGQNAMIEVMQEIGSAGVAAVEANGPAQGRLNAMRDFYGFMQAELPALIDRWRAQYSGHL
ncbi:hypothetical protein [Pseudonocardia sp. TRM90224]|uniref:hypothetical protein n=1 Tax=Pseudonocardia sp. TRM90224 TaxID=2812678 RepID=UPI001E2F742B|nr:hypothetical protein [Pseudonocardia sp. TRM90224]